MSHSNKPRRKMLYRSRRGLILGVCRGLADYTGIPVFWVRVVVIAITLPSGFFPIPLLYIVAGILMKSEPVIEPLTDDDHDFYNSWASDRSLALSRIKRRFEQLDRRARRMEDLVTAREFDWEQRMRSGD